MQQLPLGLWEQEVYLVAAALGVVPGIHLLALQRLIQTQHQDHRVAVLRHGGSLRQTVTGLAQTLHPILEQSAALGIEYPAMARHRVLNTLQDRDIAGRRAVVIADQGKAAVGVGADHAHSSDSFHIQGKQPGVFEQDAGFPGRLLGQRQMLLTFYNLIGDFVKRAALAQNAQQIPGGKQPLRRRGDLLLRDQPLPDRSEDAPVAVPAVEVAAVLQRQGHGLGGGVGDHMPLVEIPDGPAVRYHVAPEPPFAPQEIRQEGSASAAGFAVGAVIGPHDRLHARVYHAGLKGGQVGLRHILGGGLGVEAVAEILRAAVDGEMLGAGGGLHNRPVPLEAPDVGRAQPGGQIGVLAVRLMPPSPAGVPEDIDIGGPEGQTLEDVPVLLCGIGVVFRPPLRSSHVPQLFQQLIVKHGRKANGLREAGGRPSPGHAVEGLVPPVVGGDA